MNFAKTRERILKKSFDYTYEDADGKEVTENIEFSFRASFKTPAFMDAFARFEETRNCGAIAEQLSRTLTGWNLDYNGDVFLPSYENLANECDFEFLMGIVNAMLSTVQGDAKKPIESPSA